MRYFLVDKILDIKPGEYITGIKAITISDNILHDHFPDYPILPGVLIIEGLAQLTGFLLEITFNKKDKKLKRALMAQIEKIKFHETTGPGELLQYKVTMESVIDDAVKVDVEAKSNDQMRVKGKILFKMCEIDSKSLNEQRAYLFKLLTKGMKDCPKFL